MLADTSKMPVSKLFISILTTGLGDADNDISEEFAADRHHGLCLLRLRRAAC